MTIYIPIGIHFCYLLESIWILLACFYSYIGLSLYVLINLSNLSKHVYSVNFYLCQQKLNSKFASGFKYILKFPTWTCQLKRAQISSMPWDHLLQRRAVKWKQLFSCNKLSHSFNQLGNQTKYIPIYLYEKLYNYPKEMVLRMSSIKIWLEEELSSGIHSFVCSSELPVWRQFNERSQGQNCVPFATHYGCLCQFSAKILI